MNNSIKQAKKIIKNLLINSPSGDCSNFHHSKKDWHLHDDDCQPLKRYLAAINEARNFLTLDKTISEE
jgi:hypothetical protein